MRIAVYEVRKDETHTTVLDKVAPLVTLNHATGKVTEVWGLADANAERRNTIVPTTHYKALVALMYAGFNGKVTLATDD